MRLKQEHRKLIINALTIATIPIAVLGTYIGLQITLNTKTPMVAVASGSMSPALNIGDLVIVQGIPASNISRGDIIVFLDPTQNASDHTVHRVVGMQTLANGTTLFKTKGDQNEDEDSFWVPDDQVQGRVLYRIPYVGYITLDPTILVIILMVAMIVIVVWPEKGKRRRHRRRKKFF